MFNKYYSIFTIVLGFGLLLFIGFTVLDMMNTTIENLERPEGCNTTAISDCYRTYNEPCDLPFAPIIWSDC